MSDPVVVKLSAVGVVSAVSLILSPTVAGGDATCCAATGSTQKAKFSSKLAIEETSTMFVAFPSSRAFGTPASARAHFVKAGRMFNDTFRSEAPTVTGCTESRSTTTRVVGGLEWFSPIRTRATPFLPTGMVCGSHRLGETFGKSAISRSGFSPKVRAGVTDSESSTSTETLSPLVATRTLLISLPSGLRRGVSSVTC